MAVTRDAADKIQEERVSHPAIAPNHVAVITGGASGIGLAAAMRLAGLGMKVCIADLGGDRLAAAEAKLSSVARGASADVSRSPPRSAMQTFMPRPAKRIAAASPMPDAPPVMTAT